MKFLGVEYSLGVGDLKDWKRFLKSLVAELLGTMFLVLVGCGSALNWKTDTDVTQISLAFGLVVMAMVTVMGPVSGGHLNPAVSVGLLAGGHVSLLKCIFYIIIQTLGAIVGAGMLYAVTPAALRGTIGSNSLNSNVTVQESPVEIVHYQVDEGGAFVLEALLSMMLVLVVYAAAVDDKTKAGPGVAPLLIGLTVSAAHLVCITYTGTSINPARSLGAAVFGSQSKDNSVFDSHWVFWVGPLLGGLLGGLVYTFVLKDGDSPQVVVCLSEDKKYSYEKVEMDAKKDEENVG